jgi:hypothetical protein
VDEGSGLSVGARQDRQLLNAADLAPGFGSGGVAATTLPGTDGSGTGDLVVQPDGKAASEIVFAIQPKKR